MRNAMYPIAVLVVAAGVWLGVNAHAKTAAGKPVAKEVPVTSKSPEALTAFKDARDLLDNVRTAEAIVGFKKAMELDAEFAQAHAYLGSVTPGSEGMKELERGSALAAKLPANERLLIQAMLADGQGQEEKARGLWERLAQIAPGDWHVQFTRGGQLTFQRKWAAAAAALEKAAALNPKSGAVYNSLGYAYLNQEKKDQAIEAFRKYSELRPDEPNPHDSLAEALMAAGRYDEAEAEFRKAAEVSPQFYIAWAGVAQTKFLRDDWAGGREALTPARSTATRPVEKFGIDFTLAWSQFAAGHLDEALKTLDGLEKEAQAQQVDVSYAFTPIVRGNMLLDGGQPEAALQQAALASERGQKSALSGGEINGLRRQGLAVRIAAESQLGKLEDAAKSLALLEAEAKSAPANAQLQSDLELGRGELALGRGDAKAAAEAFSRCVAQDSHAHWREAAARDKAGDASGAEETRKKLLAANWRDGEYLYVRSQLRANMSQAAPAAK